MDFENLFETIEFEFVLEGIGCIFAVSLLWNFFFHDKLPLLLRYFFTAIL